MAKRTAIIDIGSNSARLVIFERSSRFGFHLICEQKSKVRIGEGAYAKNGYLQPIGIERAYLALQSFLQTIKKYHVKKTLCVATSALRDAPNGQEFVQWIRQELKLSIKIIDGNEEAKLGAIAANNLLPITTNAISIDIGGGSSDMALIQNGTIVETCSLNIGTVRIKELFFNNKERRDPNDTQRAKVFIQEELKRLPASFRASLAIGIGGTARTLSKGIMKSCNYPFEKLHAFTYSVEEELPYLNSITKSSAKNLHNFSIKKGRYDTIREGTLIFIEILKAIESNEVITSGVGVREGVFLKDMLKSNNLKFPSTLNPSIRSILDRFDHLTSNDSQASHRIKIADNLYALCHKEFGLSRSYKKQLFAALKLTNIGKILTIYNSHRHAFYLSMQELNYGFTHKEMLLVSILLRTQGVSILKKPFYQTFKPLLPKKEKLKCLSFIYTLSTLLHENANNANIKFVYSNQILTIISDQSLYHAKEAIKSLEKPRPFAIIIKDKSHIPSYRF